MAVKVNVRSILKTKGRAVWATSPDATVYEALVLMAEKEVGALVVLADQKPVGMFSERDYARRLLLHGKASRDTMVREVMSAPVVTVTPDQTVEECMRIMVRHRIRHLPVVEGDVLAGVISIGDLVNSIISAQEQTIRQLSDYIEGKYPG